MSNTDATSENPNIKVEQTNEPKPVGESQNAPQKRVFVPNFAVKREKKDVY
jgi:hypothetical protein